MIVVQKVNTMKFNNILMILELKIQYNKQNIVLILILYNYYEMILNNN